MSFRIKCRKKKNLTIINYCCPTVFHSVNKAVSISSAINFFGPSKCLQSSSHATRASWFQGQGLVTLGEGRRGGFRRHMSNAIKNFHISFWEPFPNLGSAWGGSRRRKEYHPLFPMTNCWSSNEAILLDLSLTIAWSLLFLHTDLCTRMQVCECVCVRAYLRRVFGCAVYIPACVHTKWPRWPSNNRGPLQSVFFPRKSLRNCL